MGLALCPSALSAQSRDSLLSRLADLDVSEELRAIDEATRLSAEQKERLEEVLSKTRARAQTMQSEKRSERESRGALDLLIQSDDELHAVLDCEQREAYRKYRRDERWRHRQHKRSLGEPAPRARWTPTDARARVVRLTRKMSLSDEQKAEIDRIYADAELEWASVEAVQDDEQRRARAAELHFETQDQVYAALSCNQREELRKVKQEQVKDRRQKRVAKD